MTAENNRSFYQGKYIAEIRPKLQKELDLTNIHEVPIIKKVVLNMGCGKEAVTDNKKINIFKEELTAIAGQCAVITYAKKSIAGFKIREGMKLGVKVTLRGKRMYEFLERLTNIAMPRIRDFRGLSNRSFDQRGNYSFGIKEQIIFPEINYDKIDTIRGLDVTVCIQSKCASHSLKLLKELNFPIKEE